MMKTIFYLAILFCVLALACNNSEKKQAHTSEQKEQEILCNPEEITEGVELNAVGTVIKLNDEGVALMEFLMSAPDGWVSEVEGSTFRVTKKENGNYFINNDLLVTDVEEGNFIISNYPDMLDEVGQCFTVTKQDNGSIIVGYFNQCAREEESVVFLKAGQEQVAGFEDKYGIGVVVFELSGPTYLPFYAIENETPLSIEDHPSVEIEIIEEEGMYMFIEDYDWRPFVNSLDYELLHAICYRQIQEYGGYHYLKYDADRSYCLSAEQGKFYAWDDYLKEKTFGVEPKDYTQNPVRKSPFPDAEKVQGIDVGESLFAVDEIKGEWAKISIYSGSCGEGDVYATGWIKWRDESELLIRISYIC